MSTEAPSSHPLSNHAHRALVSPWRLRFFVRGLSVIGLASLLACTQEPMGTLSPDDPEPARETPSDGQDIFEDVDAGSAAPAESEEPPPKVSTKTEGEPEIVSWQSLNIKGKLFPTYLSSNLVNVGHLTRNVVIKNPSSEKKRFILRASLQGYTKSETPVTLDLDPGATITVWADSALDYEALSKISGPVDSAITVTLTSTDGNLFYSGDRAVKILPKNQVFWTGVFSDSTIGGKYAEGTREKVAVVGVMTTPHDKGGFIDKLLQEGAKENGGQLSGYQGLKNGMTQQQLDAVVMNQARAIYTALRKRGMNYTSVTSNFFDSDSGQNVRFPAESLQATTANCIDGSLVFASAFEALGLESEIVYVPGHAYVSVHLGPKGSSMYNRQVYIETTVLATKDFVESTTIALNNHTTKYKNKWTTVPVRVAREEFGFVPFPL